MGLFSHYFHFLKKRQNLHICVAYTCVNKFRKDWKDTKSNSYGVEGMEGWMEGQTDGWGQKRELRLSSVYIFKSCKCMTFQRLNFTNSLLTIIPCIPPSEDAFTWRHVKGFGLVCKTTASNSQTQPPVTQPENPSFLFSLCLRQGECLSEMLVVFNTSLNPGKLLFSQRKLASGLGAWPKGVAS